MLKLLDLCLTTLFAFNGKYMNWICYVDNTFVIIKRTKLEATLELINNTLPRIRITGEEEKNEQLLDVMVERRNNGEFLTK
eukprot:g16402.t1